MKDRKTIETKSSMRILIIEKSNLNHLLFKMMLKEYQQERAVNKYEALQKARNGRFDAIVIDVQMSVIDELETIWKIREFNKEVPIIVLTSDISAANYTTVMEAGCCQYLTKPVTEKELTKAVSKAITKNKNKKREQILSE